MLGPPQEMSPSEQLGKLRHRQPGCPSGDDDDVGLNLHAADGGFLRPDLSGLTRASDVLKQWVKHLPTPVHVGSAAFRTNPLLQTLRAGREPPHPSQPTPKHGQELSAAEPNGEELHSTEEAGAEQDTGSVGWVCREGPGQSITAPTPAQGC